MRNDIFYFIYVILSKFPDKLLISYWFRFIVKLRARTLNQMSKMKIGNNVKIYKNMKITKKSHLIIMSNTVIKENCSLSGSIIIGRDCNILNNTTIDGSGKIIIGDKSHIGRNNNIFSHYHNISNKDTLVNESKEVYQITLIGKNVMLFSNVGIMSGVTIEDNVCIAYGSVVTKKCIKNNIYAGVPTRIIGERK